MVGKIGMPIILLVVAGNIKHFGAVTEATSLKSLVLSQRPGIEAAFISTIIFVSACLPGWYLWSRSSDALQREMRVALQETALSASLLVDGDLHLSFTDPAMEDTEEYRRETDKLRRFMSKNPRLAYLYTTRLIDGRVHFILDAALPGDADGDGIDDHSYIMDIYETPSMELMESLLSGQEGIDQMPYKDKWGTFISGYAPIHDSENNLVGILGADVRVEDVVESLAAIRRAAIGGIFIALFISAAVGIGVFSLRSRSASSQRSALAALEAQSHAETRYRQLFEQTPIGVMNYNRALQITDCNREFLEIIRTQKDKVIHLDLTSLKDSRLLPTLKDALLGNEGSYNGPYHASNRKIWIEMRTGPIRNAAGEITGGIAILENITRQHWMESMSEAEKDLLAMIARSESAETVLEKLILTMENLMSDSICSILFLDDGGRRFVGGIAPHLPDAYAQTTYQVDIGPETGSCGTAAYTGNVVIVSDISTHPYWAKFKELPLQHNLRACWSMPIRSSSGKILGTFAIYHHEIYEPTEDEVSLLERASYLAGIAMDRRLFEKELKKERTLLRALIDHLPDVVYIKDMECRYLAVNPAAARFLGVKHEQDVIGKTDDDLHSALTTGARRKIEQRVIHEAAIIHEESIVTLSDNATRRLSSSHIPLRDKDGNIMGLIMIARDITDLYLAQEENIKNQKLESLGQLAGGIAHDFNNILTSILGNLSMMRQSADHVECDHAELIQEAETATLRARNLAMQLITFSKGGQPVRKPSNVAAVVREAAMLTEHSVSSKLAFDFPQDLWSAEIDPVQITHVVHNLVANADQAMPDGGTIHVSGENVTLPETNINNLPGGDYVSISIRDHGVGIEPAIIGKVFDPYFTTKSSGSGLGLSTAYSIINKHDGKLFARSNRGEGATFTFFLPALHSPPSPSPSAPLPAKQVASGGARILIMDDDPAIVRISTRILEREGFVVQSATDGREAVNMYNEAQQNGSPFDLVILDMTIPGGMGGHETFEKLQELDPAVKAVVSSGYSEEDILARHESFGYCGIITKPFQREELINAIKTALKPENKF